MTPSTRPLRKGLAAALRVVQAEIALGRPFPTPETIAAALGWKNPSSASDALLRLAAAGHLVITRRDPVQGGWRRHYALSNASPATDTPAITASEKA